MIKGFGKAIHQLFVPVGRKHGCHRAPVGWHGILSANSFGTVVVVGVIALMSCGCVASRKASVPQGSQAQGYGQQPQGGLIKPYIPGTPGAPDASPSTGLGQAEDLRPQATSPEGRTGPGGRSDQSRSSMPSPAGTSEVRNQWESQKVKAAAIKMAKATPTVIKIKVCYAVENDEWWVTLYDDHRTMIDLKQYTWNREKLALEPYLVVRQIPRSQLERDLTRKTPGKACEILDYPASRQLM